MILLFSLWTKWSTASTPSPTVAECPPNIDICLLNPCLTTTCSMYATATCCQDGCNAYFILSNGEEASCECDSDETVEMCSSDDICEDSYCELYPDALCFESWCGSCHTKWLSPDTMEVVDCGMVDPTPSPTAVDCPADTGICFTNMCFVTNCNKFVSSTCCTNGCETYFILPDGAEVDCECHEDEIVEECVANQCDTESCDIFPKAICIESWCGSCHALWYNPDSQDFVDCDTASPTLHPVTAAPTDYGCAIEGVCWYNPCLLVFCNNYAALECCANDCESFFILPNGDTAECDCKDGEIVDECVTSPCVGASCLAQPNARCIESYCGNCHAVWYDPSTMDIVDCNTSAPTIQPTAHPTAPTIQPTFSPTNLPTLQPSNLPTLQPTTIPTVQPTTDELTTFPTNQGCVTNTSCQYNPCSSSNCAKYASLVCCAEGCEVYFLLPNGERADCDCDIGVTTEQCGANDLCTNSSTCAQQQNAVCLENWCGTCEAVWYDPYSIEEIDCDSGLSRTLNWEIRICCLEESHIQNTVLSIATVLEIDVDTLSVLSFTSVARRRKFVHQRRRLQYSTWDILYNIFGSLSNMEDVSNKLQNALEIESIGSQISSDLVVNVSYLSTISLIVVDDSATLLQNESDLILALMCFGGVATIILLGVLSVKKWRRDVKRSSIQIVMSRQDAITSGGSTEEEIDQIPGMHV